jgi:hypothetical protein
VLSCKKDNNLIIKGKVYDPNLKKYLSEVNIILKGNGVVSGVYTQGFQQIASVVTDIDGCFSVEIEKDRSDKFILIFSKDSYFSKEYEFSASVFNINNTFEKDFEIMPLGYVNVHLYNEYPFDSEDKVVYYFTNTQEECMDCCVNNSSIGMGEVYDTNFTCKFYGNSYIYFARSVTKDSNTNVYIDSLYCKAFSTETYDIPY